MEAKKRSIAKTVSWRVCCTTYWVIIGIVTGQTLAVTALLGAGALALSFFYYFHERVWDRIKWGRK